MAAKAKSKAKAKGEVSVKMKKDHTNHGTPDKIKKKIVNAILLCMSKETVNSDNLREYVMRKHKWRGIVIKQYKSASWTGVDWAIKYQINGEAYLFVCWGSYKKK